MRFVHIVTVHRVGSPFDAPEAFPNAITPYRLESVSIPHGENVTATWVCQASDFLPGQDMPKPIMAQA